MPPVQLEPEERQRATAIVAGLYDFTDGGARGRRVLLEQANVSLVLGGFDLSGSPAVVTGDLIGRLERYGSLPARPEYHALGALLVYLISLNEIPEDHRRFLAQLVLKYDLVADRGYVRELRNRYGLADIAAQPAGLSGAPATSLASIGLPAPPPFAVDLTEAQGGVLEQLIHGEDNFLDVYSLAGAIYSAWAVCRVERPKGKPIGSGFLIGPDLLLTNQHLLNRKDYLSDAVVRFDYAVDSRDVAQVGRVFELQRDFYECSPAEELDYALLRLKDRPLEALRGDGKGLDKPVEELMREGRHRGYLLIAPRFLKEHDRVNIIQHPGGNPLKVVLTQNHVALDMTDSRVRYVADTMDGSSGSPVFNQHWEVVALHHSGSPYPPGDVGEALLRVWKRRFRVNEGIPVRAILKDFESRDLLRYLPRE